MKHFNIAFFVPHLGCPHTCSFCDQHSISGEKSAVTPSEVQAVLKKALGRITDPIQRSQTEIAFFGGSFTAIDRGEMMALLEAAAPYCGNGRFSGIRISTRPDAVSEEILDVLRAHAVTAIELGVQSLDDAVLRLNERGHTAEQAVAACRLIHIYGFSLGLQMMTGLYGDSGESAYQTAEQIISLCPDTVRIYPTVVLQGTKLHRLYEAGKYCPLTTEESVPLAADLMLMFHRSNIRVIRVGLHPSQEIEENRIAGAYHPAFRELCEGEIYRRLLQDKLKEIKKGEIVISVHPKEISKLVGQKKINIRQLERDGYRVILHKEERMGVYEIEVREVDYATQIVGTTGL